VALTTASLRIFFLSKAHQYEFFWSLRGHTLLFLSCLSSWILRPPFLGTTTCTVAVNTLCSDVYIQFRGTLSPSSNTSHSSAERVVSSKAFFLVNFTMIFFFTESISAVWCLGVTEFFCRRDCSQNVGRPHRFWSSTELTISQLAKKKFPRFIEPEGSLPHSQEDRHLSLS